MSNIYLGRVLITISIAIIMMVPQIVVSQGNQSALSNSTMLKTDYAPVPENARGPTIPEKGYVIESNWGKLFESDIRGY